MKRLVAFLPLLLLALPHPAVSAGVNEEFRATWVVTWQWMNPESSVDANKALTRTILDNHKQANMNAVLWQVRQNGTAYYPSSYEPWGRYTGYQNPGYDPLAYAIQEAHTRGLELHAWMNVFENRGAADGSPAQRHPEWVCRDQAGNPMPAEIASLSPGLSAVREYLIKVAMEIVRNYDVDGLHLDYVRWNEYTNSAQSLAFAKLAQQRRFPEGMITEEQIGELHANAAGRYLYDLEHPYTAGVPAGFATWEEWWRWSVTEFVRVLHDSIQAVKPWVRLSAAVLGRYNWGPWQGYGDVYQDAALWFNQGYVDQLTPMHYHWLTGQEFYNMLTGGCPECWSLYIQPGISRGRLYTVGPGSYQLAAYRVWSNHPQIVQSSREVPWVDGFQFFSYGDWKDQNYWDEARRLFFQSKTKVRGTKLVVSVAPDPPTVALTKLDSLNYRITVTPPDTTTRDYWFAVYRSTDDLLDVGQDEIVDVHFGRSSYAYTDHFSGLQDYNGSYRYFATMLDRYWNESAISNAVQSEAIPSFAPTIVATTPAEGDTVPVNASVVIVFSKTMDVGSVREAISFSPPVAIRQLVWSSDRKTLTIEIEGNLQFSSEYSLTVSPTATDVNGRPLDGNGDGQSGDPFVLHFRTLAKDVLGPVIVSSYPDWRTQPTNFDVEDVMAFAFDEIVAPASVNSNTVFLRRGGEPVPMAYLLNTVDNRSVLSVQPLQPLENDEDYSVVLTHEITDTVGNPMASDVAVAFRTSSERYLSVTFIDQFVSVSNWWQPGQSGSTVGVNKPNTVLEMSTVVYLPASPPRQRTSASLRYEWDESSAEFLLREYLAGDQPRSIFFDTTYVLQCYVFGDGSNNRFRFCVDDSLKDRAAFHEVSKWRTLDWYGWRLLEWKLSDPASVGQWIGDGVLNGPSLRFDSFQLTHERGAALRGRIFFDNLRIVKKSSAPASVALENSQVPSQFALYQNYPNPFNARTKIAFDLPQREVIRLAVYDLLGREVAMLVNAVLVEGHHEVVFDASDLPSGVYWYRLSAGRVVLTKKMTLVR